MNKEAHTIKGIAANIGAQQLQFDAKQIEQAATNREDKQCSVLMSTLASGYKILCQKLECKIQQLSSNDPQHEPVTTRELNKQLEKLKNSLAAGEYIDVDELHFLSPINSDAQLKVQLSSLLRFIVKFDNPAAINIIKEIQQNITKEGWTDD